MMMSDSFVKSQKYRDVEYPIYNSLEEQAVNDPYVVAQFAATDPVEFAHSALLVYNRKANGIDLNCGCPQRWAWQENIGCRTPSRTDWPKFIKNCVTFTRKLVPDKNFSISVKFRLQSINDKKDEDAKPNIDFKKSMEIFQAAVDAGVDFITIHLRTRHERNVKPHYEIGRRIIEEIGVKQGVPVIINGGFKDQDDAIAEYKGTNCAGLMVAQAILSNPDFWDISRRAKNNDTPESFEQKKARRKEVITKWFDIAIETRLNIVVFQHHVIYMLEDPFLSGKERAEFAALKCFSSMVDFVRAKGYLE